ncbi:MAG: type II secretion system protein [bacterium]|nr:type II secretion system protein [bacterium]
MASLAAARVRGRSYRDGQQGFTLLEVMVGMLLLSAIVIMLSQGYMAAISRAGEIGDHSTGAAWMQAMVDHLRNTGYAGVSGSWTETAASCASPEPCLPDVFSRAEIQAAGTAVPLLKQVNITLFRKGIAAPFLALSTYFTDIRFP